MRATSLFLIATTLTLACGGKTVTDDTADGGGPDDTGTVPVAESGVDTGTEPPVDGGRPYVPSTKMDLLLVIDNSISMADKQLELARRLPALIRDLTTADPTTGKSVADLHVAVISSSLGSHGTSACAVEITNAHNNDHAHLLPRTGEGGGSGFTASGAEAACPKPVAASALGWTAGSTVDVGLATSCLVGSVKDDGCGYEETLESMYHFLVDPAPYASANVACTFGVSGDACGANKIVVSGVDDTLLAQRKAFLRPDSTVVVLVLSDENDASLKPAGLNWLPWGYGRGQMQRGWTSCASVPDDFEPETSAEFSTLHTAYKCFSCFEDASDPNCKRTWPTSGVNVDADGRNLRAFQQVQRFGYNFLWGRKRFSEGLSSTFLTDSTSGGTVANPLITATRPAGNVVFAAIVGVPPNLVNGSDGVPKTLSEADWEKIIGPVGKRDPHMIESIAPRPGIAKYAGDPSVDPVNGGDRDLDGDDLQYACIGKRTLVTRGYECDAPGSAAKNPLCASDGTQPRYKAYPGLRHLRVAHDTGGYVASICDAGLTGAMKGLVRRLQPLIK